MKLKERIINLWRGIRNLNWELILGIILIAPSIVYGLMICDYYLGDTRFEMHVFNIGQGQHMLGDIPNTFSSIPIFLGLLAIAGAYLVKGNLHKSPKE